MSKEFTPFLAHSEITDLIYIIGKNDKYEVTEQCVRAMEGTGRMPKWIPCDEKLPEKDGEYLVTLENGYVEILGYSTDQRTTYPKGFYYIKNGFSHRQVINPVMAWMSLPESYKKEGE